jgi:hypothetical protein
VWSKYSGPKVLKSNYGNYITLLKSRGYCPAKSFKVLKILKKCKFLEHNALLLLKGSNGGGMAFCMAMRSAGLQFRMRICSCFAMSGSALCRLVRKRACAEASAQWHARR